MRRVPLMLLALLAGCGSTLYSTSTAVAPAAPDDLYSCVATQLGKMGYRRMQYDTIERWFVAERVDGEGQVASGNFRRTVLVMDTKVKNDNGTSLLTVISHTYNEFVTTRGNNREEVPASSRAKLDAQTLQQACAATPSP